MSLIFAIFIGLVFGIGILLSGMVDPAKVINFFDITGSWDPSLAFVMLGAVSVTALGYRLVWRLKAPLFDKQFHVPSARIIDRRLIIGSALFGIGWGIAGFCPGAAIPAIGTGQWEVILFLVAVITGIWLRRLADR